MPVTWEKLPDEPVSIFTYSGQITSDTVTDAIQHNMKFAEAAGRKLYTIVDMSQIDVLQFPELMRIVAQVARAIIKEGEDPALMTILVGSHQTTKMYHNMLKAQGAPPMPIAQTIEEAREIVNVKIAAEKKTEIDSGLQASDLPTK